MTKDKKFYWLKLMSNFFDEPTMDFMLSQKNGCEYIVIYQMLCLKTMNNNGKLANVIGEMLIPFDAEKIARDTKYFTVDTILIALELYKKLGLVYEDNDGYLCISNIDKFTGSESKWAQMKRQQRLDNKVDNVQLMSNNDVGQLEGQCGGNSPHRDIEIENIYNVELDHTRHHDHFIYKRIINYLNELTRSNFKSTTKATKSKINARLREGFTEDDFLKVIKFKVKQWEDNPAMCGYLRPDTLFGTKFEGYLNEANRESHDFTQEVIDDAPPIESAGEL